MDNIKRNLKSCEKTASGDHNWKQIYNSDFEKTGVRFYKCLNCNFIDDLNLYEREM